MNQIINFTIQLINFTSKGCEIKPQLFDNSITGVKKWKI